MVDASCRLLAEWLAADGGAADDDALPGIWVLLRYGNPADPYWAHLPARALPLVRRMPEYPFDRRLSWLADIALYAGGIDTTVADEAHALFGESLQLALESAQFTDWDWDGNRDDLFCVVSHPVSALSESLKVLEATPLSLRNRHVAAAPDHRLVRTFAMGLETFVRRLTATEPACALHQLGRIAASIRHEDLFRRCHVLFREQFVRLAPLFSEDAGCALKAIIKKACTDETAEEGGCRKKVCEETFDALLPLLESIAPEAAKHARTSDIRRARGHV